MSRCFETINLNKTSAAKLTCLFPRKWLLYTWPWPGFPVLCIGDWMIVVHIVCRRDEKIETQLKTFFDLAQELDDSTPMKHIEEETGLSFDPRHYRAKKAVSVIWF